MEKIYVSSRQNRIVSLAAGLSDKKNRDREGLFLIDGVKLLREASASRLRVEFVMCTERALDKFELTISSADAPVYVLADHAFERVTDERAPEGVVAAVRCSDEVRRPFSDGDDAFCGVRLVLDGIQNPDNLGAILRSALAFGQRNVIIGAGSADIYGRRVMRSSMGAALKVGALYAADTAAACRAVSARGGRVIAATVDSGARPINEFEFADGDAVVIGSEGRGVSDAVADAADASVFIPMEPEMESLNASCAAAVILWEIYRRGLAGK